MTKQQFLNIVTNGGGEIVKKVLSLLALTKTDYCVIGGLAVNAYAEPLVSLDLDIVIIGSNVEPFLKKAAEGFKIDSPVKTLGMILGSKIGLFKWPRFDETTCSNAKGLPEKSQKGRLGGFYGRIKIETFQHSINLTAMKSDLCIQLQTDPRYQGFIGRAVHKDVLGQEMKVASLQDVLQGKLWAYADERRRKSKRQKDLADIYRLVEAHPHLKKKLPTLLQ